jgi:hypothetical protein
VVAWVGQLAVEEEALRALSALRREPVFWITRCRRTASQGFGKSGFSAKRPGSSAQFYAFCAQAISVSHGRSSPRRLRSSASAAAASLFAGMAVRRASAATLSRMSTFFVS